MSNLSVADSRRHEQIRRNRRKSERIGVELQQVGRGPHGMIRDTYLEQRREHLTVQLRQLQEENLRLASLANDDLVNEFCPVSAPAPEVDFRDTLLRGPMPPAQVVVHESAPLVRHQGPQPAMVQQTNSEYGPPAGWRPGVMMTTDENGNAVPASE